MTLNKLRPGFNQLAQVPENSLSAFIPKRKPVELDLTAARAEAERRFPFIQQFRDVAIAPAIQSNKGGLGEFHGPDDPGNPTPGQFAISIGNKSKTLKGGIADTIIADMVHAADVFNPNFRGLKSKLIQNLSKDEIDFARRRYEQDYKGKFSGSNFENFDNFLKSFWADGIIQHLLLPEGSEIEEIRRHNPDAVPILDEIRNLFESSK